MLSEFLARNRDAIIASTRARVASRHAPRATPHELDVGVPLFLDELIATLRGQHSTGHSYSGPDIPLSATEHGKRLQAVGFTAAQAVHDYGDVCQATTQLAIDLAEPITVDEFRTFNRVLDDAMAEAVTEFGRQRELSRVDDETERLGFFAHELRNLLANCVLAFEVMKAGTVGVSGSTGTVLGRNLTRMRDLIDRSLAEVRLKAGIKTREPVLLAHFIEEVEVSAMIDANARGLQLTVVSAPPGVFIEVDRQIFAAAVANLLQNAFKYTRAGGHVTLKADADDHRVYIAIEDECGGLAGPAEELFAAFAQKGVDRTGVGLGLAIARQGVGVNGGEIKVRNITGLGCVFTIELPRMPPEPR